MSNNSPGPSSTVQLMPEARSKNVKLCIICQRVKDNQGNSNITSTEEGRNVLIQTSQSLQDDLIKNLAEVDLSNIQYHVKTCYSTYKKKVRGTYSHRINELLNHPLNLPCRVLRITRKDPR